MKTRNEQFKELFPDAPAFRWKQIEQAMYDPEVSGWNDISTLPKDMRETLSHEVSWVSYKEVKNFESAHKDTYKAVLETLDGKRYESVLMRNKREQWTICVSSQIGCAMGCTFCATGTMGLTRSLTSDEIADQYRYWMYFLHHHPDIENRISNVVFMGMGEPLANYDNVKQTIHAWLAYTDMGPTKITVSSVGVLTQLERLLTDSDWPHVRIAISLHSANPEKEKRLSPLRCLTFCRGLLSGPKNMNPRSGIGIIIFHLNTRSLMR